MESPETYDSFCSSCGSKKDIGLCAKCYPWKRPAHMDNGERRLAEIMRMDFNDALSRMVKAQLKVRVNPGPATRYLK